ncbi:MAG: hypothetical protein DIU56_006740 [Pseudomonadota bacterium]|jgi:Osmosensitive K+ channel histidine kinase|nr:MAG: hypothetical protein DIU56_00320 [Pseudomonadota bacterium]
MASSQEGKRGPDGGSGTSGHSLPREDLERVREDASEAVAGAKRKGKAHLEAGKEAVAEQAETLAGAIDTAARQLGEQNQSLAGYASELAESIGRLAENLRSRSLDELAADTQALARRNPALFLLGSVAVGVALSRFVKASAQRSHARSHAYGRDSSRMESPAATDISDVTSSGSYASPTDDETGYEPPPGGGSSVPPSERDPFWNPDHKDV